MANLTAPPRVSRRISEGLPDEVGSDPAHAEKKG